MTTKTAIFNIKRNYFRKPSTRYSFETAQEYGLSGIENHHLTLEGLLAKMREWNRVEGGVEEYIYDITNKEIVKLGGKMPAEIRRIKN